MDKLNEQIEKTKKKLAELEAKQQAELDKMKTIIINNVEYELKQHDNNKLLSEITIPKGKRLLLPSEAMMLYERGLLNNTFWFYVEQTNKKEKANGAFSRFYTYSGRANLFCDWNSTDRYGELGVLFAKDLKVNKSKLIVK